MNDVLGHSVPEAVAEDRRDDAWGAVAGRNPWFRRQMYVKVLTDMAH